MIKTFDRTMFISNEELQKSKVLLYITKGLKWEDDNEVEVVYTGLIKWSIISGVDAVNFEIENNIIETDECQEYLVLEFNDGTTITFKNSHVDMFIK